MPLPEDVLKPHKEALKQFAENLGLAADTDSQASRYQKPGERERTVANKSLVAYRSRGLNLLNQYIRSFDADAVFKSTHWPEYLPSPIGWVTWLTKEKITGISGASWRLYRRSAAQILLEWPEPDPDLHHALETLEKTVSQTNEEMGQRRHRLARAVHANTRTSGKRLRFITPADLAAILSDCFRLGSYSFGTNFNGLPDDNAAYALADWLVAGLALGLRPCEWRQSRLVYLAPESESSPAVDGQARRSDVFWKLVNARMSNPVELANQVWPAVIPFQVNKSVRDSSGSLWLVIYNAKHSNNRGNEETRSINISAAPLHVKLSILRMVIRGHFYLDKGSWEAFQRNLRMRLLRVNDRLFPDRKAHITLYSCRHQAMANFKASAGTFSAAVIAGHGYSDTPGLFYETRRFAWSVRWQEMIQAFLSGEIDDIASLLTDDIISIRSDGRLQLKKKRKGRGGRAPKVDDTKVLSRLSVIQDIVCGLSEMPTPGVTNGEVRNLKLRDARKQAAYEATLSSKGKVARPKGLSTSLD